jgi:FtsH-binding integral membrane protein
VTLDWRRLRPAELLAAPAAVLLGVALFLPWFEIGGVRENAWQALTVTEIPSALAALAGFCLVVVTLARPAPAVPLAFAVATVVLAGASSATVGARAAALPSGATARCYGLWLALGASVVLLLAAIASLRDERPVRGAPVTG